MIFLRTRIPSISCLRHTEYSEYIHTRRHTLHASLFSVRPYGRRRRPVHNRNRTRTTASAAATTATATPTGITGTTFYPHTHIYIYISITTKYTQQSKSSNKYISKNRLFICCIQFTYGQCIYQSVELRET